MSDERFEEFLQREAKAYNEPAAETPRDAMWEVVSKARAARLAARLAARPEAGAPVTALPTQRPQHAARRYASWIGMAATLLIGVGIGRFALRTDGLPTAGIRTASAPTSDSALTPAAAGGQVDAPPSAQALAMGGTRVVPAVPVATGPARPDVVPTNGVNRMNGIPATTPYSVASQRHMASAEALITVVTATPRDAMMDSLTTKWAREMLSSTRLLLDSPAGDDALRRRLLEDLETLLVQLVQRSGGAVDERDLIDRTLQRTQLLTRLRTNAAGT
jgi:hypothetical protein